VEESLGIDRHDRLGGPEKAASVARHQDWRTLYNSLVMCIFTSIAPESILELVNSACGFEMTLEELIQTGERGWNLKRLINHRLGLIGANDCMPKAFRRPYQDHPDAEAFVPDFHAMLSAYYASRGWDPVSGVPLPEKIEELGLTWAAGGIEPKRSKL
jgi:aldehyde:ferredoxin oxidoreductase